MANRDFKKIERIMKDFSQNIGDSGSGSGGMAMVNTLPEVGREDTLYKLPNGNVYSWSRVVDKELIPVYKPVKVGDVVTLKNEIGVEDLVTFTGTGEKTNIDELIPNWTQEGKRSVYRFVRQQQDGLDGPGTYSVWFYFGDSERSENAGYTWQGEPSSQDAVSLTKNNFPFFVTQVPFEITQDFVDVLENYNVEINDLAFMFADLEVDHYETIEHVVFEGYTKLNGSYLIDMAKLNGSSDIDLDNLYYDAQEIYSNILMGAEVTTLSYDNGMKNLQKVDHIEAYTDSWRKTPDIPQMKLYYSDGTQCLHIALYSNYLTTITGQELIDNYGIWNENGYMGCSAVLGEPQVTDEQWEELMEVPVKDGKFASMLEGLIYLTSVKKGDQYEIRYTDTTRKDSKDLLLGTVSDLNIETIFRSLGISEVLVSGEPINGSINLTKEYKVSTIIEFSNGIQIVGKFNATTLDDCFYPNPYAPSVVKGKFFNDIIDVVYPEDAQVFVRSANIFNYIGEYLTEQGIPDERLDSGIIVKMFGEELQYRLDWITSEDNWSNIYASWKNSSEESLGGEKQDFTYSEHWAKIQNIEVHTPFDDTKDYSTSLIATLSDGSTIEVPTTMDFWNGVFNIVWPA